MKIRTDFVTNSSSANYSVTLRVDGSAGEHAEIQVHTYDGNPWYEDTEQGCESHDGRARVLSYHVNSAVVCAKDCKDARELSNALLSAVREYGWGHGNDWWQRCEGWNYIENSWLRERMLEAGANGAEDYWVNWFSYDFKEYVDELRSRGRKLEGFSPEYPPWITANAMPDFRWRWYRDLIENITRGWSFAIVGEPRIYESRAELESYVVEHGGTVDDSVKATTDFVIYCYDRAWEGNSREVFWAFSALGVAPNLERYLRGSDAPPSYEWKYFEGGDGDGGFSDLDDYCGSFHFAEGCFDHLFRGVLGDIVSEEELDVGYFVIPEHEFIRRFDPERERGDWMPFDLAHPVIAHRFAQVLESCGITPDNLEAVSYERYISAFGDSVHLLGFDESERGTDVAYDGNGHASWSSWGDSEDVDRAYRED